MAFTLLMPYRNSGTDATGSIIARFANFLRRGFVQAWLDTERNVITETFAPVVSKVVGALQIQLAPGANGYMVVAADGMIAVERTSTYTLSVVAGVKNYICLRLKYNPSIGAAISEWVSMTASAYAASDVKSQLVIALTVTPGAMATEVTLATDVDYSERNRVEGLFDSNWRPSVADFASLPTTTTDPGLKVGDSILARDSLTIYGWDGSTWVPVGGAAVLTAHQHLADMAGIDERRRRHGSGVVAKNRNSSAAGQLDAFDICVENAGVAASLYLATLRLSVAGLYFRTRTESLALSAKPGSGVRYDLAYVEVYREAVTDPASYALRDSNGTTRTALQAQALLMGLTDTEFAGNLTTNFEIPSFTVAAGGVLTVTRYNIRIIDDLSLAAVQDLYFQTLTEKSPTNSDSNAWSWASTQSDKSVWISNHSDSVDGKAYALPLLLVKRTAAEDHTTSNAVKVFRSGARYVFPVHPVVYDLPASAFSIHDVTKLDYVGDSDLPTGFLSPVTIERYSSGTYLGIAEDVHLNLTSAFTGIFGALKLPIAAASTRIPLSAAPASGTRRDFLYLEVKFVLFPDKISGTAGRLTFALANNTLYNSGTRPVYCQIDTILADVGDQVTDTLGAMTEIGASQTAFDSGLWYQDVSSADFDPRVLAGNVTEVIYYVPIALIRRRNTGAFNVGTNPYGGQAGTRPDGRRHDQVHAKDVVPLWHLVGHHVDREEILRATFEANLRGELISRMSQHPSWAGEAGGDLLMAEGALTSPVSGVTSLLPCDGYRWIWSAANEFFPVPFDFVWDADTASGDGVFAYVAASGNLTFTLPAGLSVYEAPNTTSPVFVGNVGGSVEVVLLPATWTIFNGSTPERLIFSTYTRTTVDTTGAFAYEGILDFSGIGPSTAGLTARLSLVVAANRNPGDAHNAANAGLSYPPDDIVQATWGPTGTEEILAVRPLVITIEKTVTGTDPTVTITSTEVEAACAHSGTATIEGVLGVTIQNPSTMSYTLSGTLNNAQTSVAITITGLTLTSQKVAITLAYKTTDCDRWLHFSRAAKRVELFHQWSSKVLVAPTGDTQYFAALPTGTMFIGSPMAMRRATGTTNAWTLLFETLESNTGGGAPSVTFPNLVRGSRWFRMDTYTGGAATSPAGTYDYRVVCNTVNPPAAVNEDWIVYYLTTPYQGLSEDAAAYTPSTKTGVLKAFCGEGTVVQSNGITFATTAGYAPKHAIVETAANHSLHGMVYPYNPAASYAVIDAHRERRYSRGQGFLSMGNERGFMGYRGQNMIELTGSGASIQHPAGLVPFNVPSIGYDACIDRLPYPDFTSMFAQGQGSVSYLWGDVNDTATMTWMSAEGEGNIYPWTFQYRAIPLASDQGQGAGGGGFLIVVPNSGASSSSGSRLSIVGQVLSYGDYSTYAAAMEAKSFVNGERGVAISHPAYSDNQGDVKLLTYGTSFLGFGNLEGLWWGNRLGYTYKPFDEGSSVELPTYLAAGGLTTMQSTTTVTDDMGKHLYTGHATLMSSSYGMVMMISGAPHVGQRQTRNDTSGDGTYEFMVGGTFDVFWPLYRPLLPSHKNLS